MRTGSESSASEVMSRPPRSKTSAPISPRRLTCVRMRLMTLEQVEAIVEATDRVALDRRFRECSEGQHVWTSLAESPFGKSESEYCGWCFRVRFGSQFEGWTA